MISVERICIAHYTPLLRRKEFLVNQFDKHGIVDYEWFEQEPTLEEFAELYDDSPKLWELKVRLGYDHATPYRRLNKSDISLLYKHIMIWKYMVDNNIETCLVLEDDVIFAEGFINDFNFNLHITPKDWDLIFIGSGCGLRIPAHQIKPHSIAYKKEHPASKCSDSYIIKKDAAVKILTNIIPFVLPIDFELNYHMAIHDMNVYWWEPPIVKQGSECGVFDGSNTER